MRDMLRSTGPLIQWCTGKLTDLGLSTGSVCAAPQNVQQTSKLLLNAIREKRRCER